MTTQQWQTQADALGHARVSLGRDDEIQLVGLLERLASGYDGREDPPPIVRAYSHAQEALVMCRRAMLASARGETGYVLDARESLLAALAALNDSDSE
jgi:hypothetical protein